MQVHAMNILNKSDREFDFTNEDFTRARKLIYQYAGIALAETKAELVYGRLSRILRSQEIRSFKEYLDSLMGTDNQRALEEFINALTTNLTSFFRENHHFPILAEHLASLNVPITIWCCAASTGEEPYSIAMTACEVFKTITPPVKIIATDIDTNVLLQAESGIFSSHRISKLSEDRREQFFLRGTGKQEGFVKIRQELRNLVSYQHLNLLNPRWPLHNAFDAIFCRNVMIYFDKTTQTKILHQFLPLMKPHALIFFGHSENFMYQSEDLKLCGKTVYELKQQASTHHAL